MKKRVALSALALAASMGCMAGAANVGMIDNGYPGDTEAQAQMLYDLGLFKGTAKGSELEKPMTRAEAAVMLTRLLGAEETALSENNTHPFDDVPEWASPYIGWLYKNGLTNGMSATEYGPDRNITCEQYSLFLTRVARDSDEFKVIPDTETGPCDSNGFVRGDAVSLSARLLGEYYEKNNNSDGTSVAMHLIEQGVFTRDKLKEAAWDVLPRTYELAGERGSNEESEQTLSCMIAGVPVARSGYSDINPISLYGETAQAYGYTSAEDGSCKLYRIDPDTVEASVIAEYPTDRYFYLAGSVAGKDYLIMRDYENDGSVILEADKEKVTELETRQATGAVFYGDKGICAFDSEDSIGVISAAGVKTISRPTEGSKVCAVVDGCVIAQDVAEGKTVISCLDPAAGDVYSSATVENKVPMDDVAEGDKSRWLEQNAPSLSFFEEDFFGGSAGLFRFKDKKIEQLTDRRVYDWAIDPSDGSIVAIATEPDFCVGYTGAGVYNAAGNEVIRIAEDGTETVLLSNTPVHGLIFNKVSCANNGEVRVVYTYVMGMSDTHSYEYAIENGRPRPLVHEPGYGYSGYTKDECAKEQARLDAIYGKNAGTPERMYKL